MHLIEIVPGRSPIRHQGKGHGPHASQARSVQSPPWQHKRAGRQAGGTVLLVTGPSWIHQPPATGTALAAGLARTQSRRCIRRAIDGDGGPATARPGPGWLVGASIECTAVRPVATLRLRATERSAQAGCLSVCICIRECVEVERTLQPGHRRQESGPGGRKRASILRSAVQGKIGLRESERAGHSGGKASLVATENAKYFPKKSSFWTDQNQSSGPPFLRLNRSFREHCSTQIQKEKSSIWSSPWCSLSYNNHDHLITPLTGCGTTRIRWCHVTHKFSFPLHEK